MKHSVRPVWPVDPARWGQDGDDWTGQIEIPRDPAPACECLVAIRLPDGQLVRYGIERLWSFPREWQPTPAEISDYQI